MSDSRSEVSQYWVQFLVKNWQEMCDGIRQLRGQDLNEHLQQVLDVARHVLQVAIAGGGIAAQYLPGVRIAIRRLGECLQTILSVAGAVLETALVVVGGIVQMASKTEAGRSVGGAIQTVGQGIGAIANGLVALIRQVLADIDRAISDGGCRRSLP